MRFAVQILNYINFKVTLEALQFIIDAGYKDLDIYVLDNGSSNNSFEEIKQFIHQKKLDALVSLRLSKQNLGFSGGHKYIYEWIKVKSKKDYQFHLILNSDALVPINFFHNVVRRYSKEKKHYPLYGFAIHDPNDQTKSSVIQSWNKFFAFARKHKALPQINTNFGWQYYPSGAALLIDPKYIGCSSLFDKKLFLYGEEIDLVFKLQHKDMSFKIYDDLIITHNFGQSTFIDNKKRNLFNEFYYQRSKIILMDKYFPKRVILVRLSLIPIIFWRLFFGYFNHLSLLLKIFFLPTSKLKSMSYEDL